MPAELREALAAVGYDVRSVSELRTSGKRYKRAIPVLLQWLPLVSDPSTKGEIVRALSVPWGRDALPILLEEFRSLDPELDPSGSGLRWTIGNAIEVLANDSFVDELMELAEDRHYGMARQMLVLGLGRSSDPRVPPLLIKLLADDDVAGQAVQALGRLRVPESRTALEQMLDYPRPWVRREAKKALARML